jgi:G:T/U-mismatch repair DNA glycosylase
MASHTIIVGTSKSKSESGYYIHAKSKFWGTIHKAGLTSEIFKPSEYEKFSREYEISFDEIYNEEIVSRDVKLKENLNCIKDGLNSLIDRIEAQPSVTNIAFNGKTAAGWFLEYLETNDISKRPSHYLNKKFGKDFYGELPFKFKDKRIYILPNTSGVAFKTWVEKPWIDFWKLFVK